MLSRALLAAERFLRRANEPEPWSVAQVLVLEYRLPLGCLVHMTPVFEAMKRCSPGIKVIVATRGLGLQVLRHSRFVDALIETPDPTTDLAAALFTLRKELYSRKLKPDCVLTGASDQRTRIALMAVFGSSGWRGGYTLKPGLYHKPLSYDSELSLIGNNLRLPALLSCKAIVHRPRVFFSRVDAASAEAMLQASNPEARPIAIMVTQNSGGQSTGWHTDRWVEVIRHASLVLGHAVVYVGTAADAPAIEVIREAAGGIGSSIAGRTSVSELSAVLAASDLMVTLDTGTLHVGRAAGVPMVVLGPSWQRPLEWMPLGVDNVRILRGADRNDIPEGYRLDEITTPVAIAAMEELSALYPASPTERQQRLQDGLSEVDHLPLDDRQSS